MWECKLLLLSKFNFAVKAGQCLPSRKLCWQREIKKSISRPQIEASLPRYKWGNSYHVKIRTKYCVWLQVKITKQLNSGQMSKRVHFYLCCTQFNLVQLRWKCKIISLSLKYLRLFLMDDYRFHSLTFFYHGGQHLRSILFVDFSFWLLWIELVFQKQFFV